MRRYWIESIVQPYGPFDGTYFVMEFILKPKRTAELCQLIRIYESCSFCVKNVKPSHFSGVIEMGSICFMLERKSFSDSQSSEVIMMYCLTRKLKMFLFFVPIPPYTR